ncbi:MAG: NADH:ubiquinone reductase (Na(+)-transporting) subunit B [Gemmatimonadetes bacterium]|jgi:Na+-transporting NADH:ubiquinone oxidoreductase subunit B|nr:NADH:ubiquinone reductase (Na(+)-transporting) subunit B [Gemmatimonadota bacterium]
MKFLRNLLDQTEPHFEKGPLKKLYPLYEALDTFLYTPGKVNEGPTHVRDGIDLKRMMSIVIVALLPCIFMAFWNTGYQANLAMAKTGLTSAEGWRGVIIDVLEIGYDPGNFFANILHGALYFLPVYIVCMIVGIAWEVLFCSVRGHEVNEGFFVSGMLIPLILPPTIPLWQVAIGTSFGVVLGKEVFGGTGKNFLNPALTARAFLYFAYPAEISGDAVWTAVDGYTSATPLGLVPAMGMQALGESMTWMQAFLGTIPGSMGETSALACLLGAGVLILTGVGSWRIMLGLLIGTLGFSELLCWIGSDTNLMFGMSAKWHLVLGGFAFGAVFMATDPVSATMTDAGKWVYGLLIGFMTVLIRVINPAFPEGVMLAILFGNVFAPVIDHFVVQANIKRRMVRTAA